MAGIFLVYSLLASTLLIVVWAVYKCVLANTGCFRFNRILLLSCITLAFVAPIFILNPFWVADIMENNIEIAFNPVDIAYIANTYRGYCHDYLFPRFTATAGTIHSQR